MGRIYSAKLGSLAADPAWQHRDKATKKGKHWGGAEAHYDTMPTADICRMKIPPLADDCWLWLWRLHTHHLDALQVAEAWGFNPTPVSELIWVKKTNDNEKIRMGMGHSLRMAHETCLLFKRGKPRRANAGQPSVFMTEEETEITTPEGIIVESPRLEHSRKPDEFYQIVDEFVGAVPRAEMFARRRYKNWLCYGNQLPPREQ